MEHPVPRAWRSGIDGRPVRPQKNLEIDEILGDMCITFGAILQTVAWRWFKESPIQPMETL